jgi:flagellar hook protein FlgE
LALSVTGWTTGGAAVPQALAVNLGTAGQSNGLTQFGGAFAVTRVDQNGLRFGNFTGITIDQAGIVTANFDNGLKTAIYLIPIATFPDPDGLAPQSGNVYLQTNQSGSFLMQQAGIGSAGQIASSSLENSTVDIAQEFANLIVTQRAYEANAKIITTSDQMLQTLISAKQ